MVFLTVPVSIESLIFPRDLPRAEFLRGTQYNLVKGRKEGRKEGRDGEGVWGGGGGRKKEKGKEGILLANGLRGQIFLTLRHTLTPGLVKSSNKSNI